MIVVKRSSLWLFLLYLFICSFDLHALDKIPAPFWQSLKKLDQPLTPYVVIVTVKDQMLSLFKNNRVISTYKISTSKYGIGSRINTQKTPTGLFKIAQKIGKDAPSGTIFYARADSGEICKPNSTAYQSEDLVLTRILWLDGLESGINKGKDKSGKCVDSFERYIYIHGTNHEKKLGSPSSHGCIRMSSKDIIELFDQIPEGTLVWIYS